MNCKPPANVKIAALLCRPLQTSNRHGLCSVKITMNADLFLYYGGPNPPPPLLLLYCYNIKDQLLAEIQSI